MKKVFSALLVALVSIVVLLGWLDAPRVSAQSYEYFTLDLTTEIGDGGAASCTYVSDQITCSDSRGSGVYERSGVWVRFDNTDWPVKFGGMVTGTVGVRFDLTYNVPSAGFWLADLDTTIPAGWLTAFYNVNEYSIPTGQTVCLAFINGTGSDVDYDGACDHNIDSTSSFTPDSDADAWPWGYRHPSSSWSGSFTISNIEYVIIGTPPPIEENPPLPYDEFCTFTVTNTVTITDTYGVTTTQTITTEYTVDSNYVQNPSFEDYTSYVPDQWTPIKNGQQSVVIPFFQLSPSLARTGQASVYDSDNFDLYGDVELLMSGDYALGFHARCAGTGCNDHPTGLLFGSTTVTYTSNLTFTYKEFSGTVSTGGGAQYVIVRFNATDATVVDDVFMYPVDENGNQICSEEYYPVEEEPEPLVDCLLYPDSSYCLPIPVTTGGTTCYYCQRPFSADAIAVSYWLAWLACIIRNLFVCDLRIWLLVVGNWTNGVVQIGLAFLAYLPNTFQGGVDWIASQVVPGISIVSTASTNGWDVLLALVQALQDIITTMLSMLSSVIAILGILIQALSDMLFMIVSLILNLSWAVRDAFAVAPYTSGITTPDSGDLALAGPNESKVFYFVLLAIGTVDAAIAYVDEYIIVALGGASLLAAYWTIQKWQDLTNF